MLTVFVARDEALLLLPLRVVVDEDEGTAGTMPLAREGGVPPGPAAVSPGRTVLMVTVERPFALAGIYGR